MSKFAQIEKLAQQASSMDWAQACADPSRAEAFAYEAAGIRLDFSREHLTEESLQALHALAEDAGWEARRAAQWAGEPVNRSEQRAVLHGALRNPDTAPEAIAERVRQNEAALEALVGAADLAEKTAVLHIGIGGSDLGPRLVADTAALGERQRTLHFLNNLDDSSVSAVLDALDPHRVLVVVVSKTFTTAETRALQQVAVEWLERNRVNPADALVAVTGNAEQAQGAGVRADRILDLPDWVGGRYSLWSAVSVSLALAFGIAARQQLLAGARAMDTHFLRAPLAENLPALSALIGIWHSNAQRFVTRIVVPYADRLGLLPEYLQQLEMESNGKRVDLSGQPLGYATAPATFGGVGSCVQHAFFQLLHQSDTVHPVEFVVPASFSGVEPRLHQKLLSNAIAQACALTQGRPAEGDDQTRCCPGGRPSSFITLRRLDMYHLGALLAFYEHRTTVQGWVWGLNSFDQFGVEVGKKIASTIEQAWNGESDYPDASAAAVSGWLKGVSA